MQKLHLGLVVISMRFFTHCKYAHKRVTQSQILNVDIFNINKNKKLNRKLFLIQNIEFLQMPFRLNHTFFKLKLFYSN